MASSLSSSSSSSENKKKKMLRLVSKDEQAFEVEEKVIAAASQIIKNLVEEEWWSDNNNNAAAAEEGGVADNKDIPISNVDCSTLSKIIQYCNYHHGNQEQQQDQDQDQEKVRLQQAELRKKKWNEEFLESLDMDGLHDLLMAASYLAMEELLDLITRRVADMITGKSVSEIRRHFNIENDFSPEEEDEIKKRYPWAFNDD